MFFESYPIPRRRVEGRGGGREEGRVHAEYEGFFMVSAMKRVLGRPVVCLSPFAICLFCLFFLAAERRRGNSIVAIVLPCCAYGTTRLAAATNTITITTGITTTAASTT